MIAFNRLNNYLKNNPPKIERGYSQSIYTFDIENSNGYVINGVARPFDYSKPPEFYIDKDKVSLLYLWQFGVDGVYFYGRTMKDFLPILEYIATRPYKSILWVHNFSHEFQFLLNIIEFDTVFARKSHKPMKATYKNAEFRCTFMLTRQSLKNAGKALGVEKLDTLDYDDIKTPETPLQRQELDYGSRDVEIVEKIVLKHLKEYKYVQKIPLTQTGKPRAKIKRLYQKDVKHHKHMTALLPRSIEEYARLRMAFVGGWVHANYYYVNTVLRDCVWTYDITSSYPFQLVSRLYPQTPWTESPPEDFEYYLKNDDFLELLEVTCKNVNTRGFNDYLSSSKVYDEKDVRTENGRIYYAKEFTVLCTSIDYQIIRECYAGQFEIKRLWYSKAGYLDLKYVNYILDLYRDKVELTGDAEKEELRARSKEILNSLYGMQVSALVYDDVDFVAGEWKRANTDAESVANHAAEELEKLRSKPYKNFVSYSHGVFCTAYARLSLWEIIRQKAINKKIVYHDTDSIYCVGRNREIFDEYNERVKKTLKAICKQRKIDVAKVCPKDVNGKTCWLGVYTCDNDDKYDSKPFYEFKTLGAKRYCYRPRKTDKIKITIAGVSKKNGVAALHDNIDNFRDGLVFNYRECGKLLPHYRNDQPATTWIDRDGRVYVSHDKFGITLQPARYELSIGQSFLDALDALGSLSNNFSELTIEELHEIETT